MHELDSLVTILLHHFGIKLPDYMAMLLFVMVGTLVVFWVGTRRLSVNKPGTFQQILELLTETVGKFLDDIIGHDGRKYMAPIGTFAVLILISNLMGLVPGLMPPTGNIIVTISLALCSFVTYNFLGIRAQGFSYIKHFMGPVLVLTPLFFPIEIISHLARPLSLSIRLFGNIFGDHQVAGVFQHLVPIVIPVPFILLGLLVAVIQTLVFSLLSMIYIAEAVEHH
jgi:F-type H+-transporting ATPase subunit a